MESLSLRYRALDALLKGLLQDEDTTDLDTLYRVAADKGIPMPAIEDQTPTQDIFAHPEAQSQSPSRQPCRSGSVASSTSPNKPVALRPAQKQSDERLIPGPHGVAHYIGPASSFEFAVIVRELVARCAACPNCRQLRTREDFVVLEFSKALEPRTAEREIEGADGAASGPDGSGQSITPGASQFPKANNDRISDFLPHRSIADELVKAFFQHVHPNYPLFHRSRFQQRYEAEWDRKVAWLRDLDPGWLSCLMMIFVFGAQQALEPYDHQQATLIKSRCIGVVRQTLGRLLSTTSLLNVQALLLFQLYEHNAGERNASWMLLGCALRMAVALGMHREGTNDSFEPVERNVRKRVWSTLYIFEKLLSVILGRPSAIDDSEISVSLPDESIFESSDAPDTPPGYTNHLLSLTKLLERVKRDMYPLPGNENAGPISYLLLSATQLLEELDSWYGGLPNHLLPGMASLVGKQSRAVLLLHVCHLYTKILVTKPLLLQRVIMELELLERGDTALSNLPEDMLSLSRECVQAAEESLGHLKTLSDAGLLEGVGWIDVYYIYHSVFILCLDILVRPIDLAETEEERQRKELIKSSMEITRSTRLARTFHILAHVASQFASSVGALDEPNNAAEGNDTPNAQAAPAERMQLGSLMQQPQDQDVQPETFATWYEANTTGLSWDYFDMGSYGPVALGGLQTNFVNYNLLVPPLANNLGPGPFRPEGDGLTGTQQADDWAARAHRDMGRGYT